MKELYQIPLGNTFGIRFYTKVNGEPEDLSDAQNLKVRIRREHSIGGILATDLHYEQNVVSFVVRGDRQHIVGDYTVTISYDKPNPSLFPPTSQRTFSLPAFRLTLDNGAQGGAVSSDIEISYVELEASIAPGRDGAKGDKGDRGEKGDAGTDGFIGRDGKSAYQMALEGGFVGTQAAFNTQLASIGEINSVLDALNGEVV